MNLEHVKKFYESSLVVKDFNLEISKLLTEEEKYILFDFGLPLNADNKNELDFSFDKNILNKKEGLVEIGVFQGYKNSPLYIDLVDHEIKTQSFNKFTINSSLKQMLLCSFEFENFIERKKREKKGKEKLKLLHIFKENMYKIDPDIDHKGYYWGSTIEEYLSGVVPL